MMRAPCSPAMPMLSFKAGRKRPSKFFGTSAAFQIARIVGESDVRLARGAPVDEIFRRSLFVVLGNAREMQRGVRTPSGVYNSRRRCAVHPLHLAAFPEDAKERRSKNLVYWTTARESYVGFSYNTRYLKPPTCRKTSMAFAAGFGKTTWASPAKDTRRAHHRRDDQAKGDGFVRKLREQNLRII